MHADMKAVGIVCDSWKLQIMQRHLDAAQIAHVPMSGVPSGMAGIYVLRADPAQIERIVRAANNEAVITKRGSSDAIDIRTNSAPVVLPAVFDRARLCQPTCQPTVMHHYPARASYAECSDCGATAPPVHWPTAQPPPDVATAALNRFREEFHHAD